MSALTDLTDFQGLRHLDVTVESCRTRWHLQSTEGLFAQFHIHADSQHYHAFRPALERLAEYGFESMNEEL